MSTKITIGSDPEYAIMIGRHVQSAGQILEAAKIYSYPEIGSDCGLGEFRPAPAYDPLQHVDNIEILIKKVIEHLPKKYELKAGTIQNGYSIGGHIHVGMPVKSRKALANHLSYYCGIPLKKIEDPEDLKIRGLDTGNYGYFGGYDTKSYGIEWRMPASWLINKDITTASLCLAHVVANEYLINPTRIIMNHEKYISLVKGDITEIISEIEKMEEYYLYRIELEVLFQLINNGEVWPKNQDMREGWQ